MERWQFWVDRGGTFTDIVARSPEGVLATRKLLSENPGRYRDAAIAGIRAFLGVSPDERLPADRIGAVKMGSTVATNALLERKGARTLLVVDAGLEDHLLIGDQTRPKLFDLDIRRPAPLYEAVIGVGGRLSVDGDEIAAFDEAAVLAVLQAHKTEGFEAVAIAMIHAWKHPQTEQRLADLARQAGFAQVTCSHEIGARLGLRDRAYTAVVDAYLSPVLRRYVDQVTAELDGASIHFMQSSGGLTDAHSFQGRNAILSGPAGGVVGAVRTAETAGFGRIIGFDMGGTSTDVMLYAGRFERTTESVVAGVPISSPSMAIHTVAAGGGSVLRFDSGRFRVGPESAGAFPGPVAYRNGGRLSVTDANVMTGKILPHRFPAVFGPEGSLPLDAQAVTDAFMAVAEQIRAETGLDMSPRAIAEGFLEVAVSHMAQAVRQVSLEKGHDAREFALQCFGGAGGQHACRVAEALGMTTILIPPYAGVLSAFGMGLADQSALRSRGLEINLDETGVAAAAKALQSLAVEAFHALRAYETSAGLSLRRTVHLRYEGSDTALDVDFAPLTDMRSAFGAAHLRRFGFAPAGRAIVIEGVEVEATCPGAPVAAENLPVATEAAEAVETATVFTAGADREAGVYDRESLRPGHRIAGPALIFEAIATTVVEPGWLAEVTDAGVLILTRTDVERPEAGDSSVADPVQLELFNNRFTAIAEQMGVVLCHTSSSVNIKERLDFSCALFDAEGQLIANAPHVPVHLGAMGESVRTVIRSRGDSLKPGDVIVLNNPFNGGTHLPDVTVISPVFDEAGKHVRFFVGNRGHHADIGGLTPGSTPPDSATLDEEGVVIDDFLIRDGATFREAAFRALLADAPYPARNPDVNVADILAQIAANEAGIRELKNLVDNCGWQMVTDYMRHVRDNAEESVRRVIVRLKDGHFDYRMDDGSHLRAAIHVDHDARSAIIDFTGTDAARSGNFNAPPSVTRASVLFAFRCLVGDDLPLNEGCMKPLNLILPEGSFLSPAPGHAVVAGNTEVSQAVCNALFGALGVVAAAQGTMNNFLFGNARYQYYETIGGGAGAGAGFAGASGVHTYMTNTRITDPEVLELRYPVRLRHFGLRRGSGGVGAHHGGDGIVRSVEALEPLTATLVASRREVAPHGLEGGEPGAVGRQYVVKADGSRIELSGRAQCELSAGDIVTIETPGGGGFGSLLTP
ncbi:MAG: hydantoinase B/oxoprolinase family protein [Asticcacaulis sp.]|uniref:hydantoinase B/oxoprolinase family protein n=1 Tax=Asticcacaulis sp. TaxID=1872648 RepID=UPI0039E610AF